MSAGDLATTVMFADQPVVGGITPMRGLQVTQLQTAVNAVRAAAGLPPATFSSVTAGTIARASHIEELRAALDPARAALGLPAVVYSRRPLVPAMLILAADINETRGGVR